MKNEHILKDDIEPSVMGQEEVVLATGVGLITEFDLKVNMISWICFYTRYPNIRLHDGDFEPEVG